MKNSGVGTWRTVVAGGHQQALQSRRTLLSCAELAAPAAFSIQRMPWGKSVSLPLARKYAATHLGVNQVHQHGGVAVAAVRDAVLVEKVVPLNEGGVRRRMRDERGIGTVGTRA